MRWAIPFLALAVAGCQSKVGECNKLAEIVNGSVAKITQVENRVTEDPEQLAKDANDVADLAEKTATEIGALAITTAELKPRADTYQAVANDMAEVSREFASLMDKAGKVQGERLTSAEAKFTQSQGALEKVCAEGSEDCRKLAEVLENQPDDPNEGDLGKVLGAYIKDLGSVPLSDAKVQPVVKAHLAAVADYKKVIDDWTSLQSEVDDAEGRLDAIVAREDKVVEDLNAYCVGSS